MNTSANGIYSCRKATIYAALMFALAVMLLVVSCPLKRLLQNNFVSNSSSAVKGQTNINHRTGADYSAFANSCADKKEIILAKPDLFKQSELLVPLYLSNIIRRPGFTINYFLSGTNYNYAFLVSSHYSTLPLFLQHLRLLI